MMPFRWLSSISSHVILSKLADLVVVVMLNGGAPGTGKKIILFGFNIPLDNVLFLLYLHQEVLQSK